MRQGNFASRRICCACMLTLTCRTSLSKTFALIPSSSVKSSAYKRLKLRRHRKAQMRRNKHHGHVRARRHRSSRSRLPNSRLSLASSKTWVTRVRTSRSNHRQVRWSWTWEIQARAKRSYERTEAAISRDWMTHSCRKRCIPSLFKTGIESLEQLIALRGGSIVFSAHQRHTLKYVKSLRLAFQQSSYSFSGPTATLKHNHILAQQTDMPRVPFPRRSQLFP
jgi:hypothetical protein